MGMQRVCLIPNDFSDVCMECNDSFSITNRRHHCYHIKCGKLICGKCSEFKMCDPNSDGNCEQIRCCKRCIVKDKLQKQTVYGRMESVLKKNLHIVMIMIILAIVFRDYFFDLCLKSLRNKC